MLSPSDLEAIAKVPIFAALPATGLARLAALARRVDLDGPTLVFAEGEPAREMVVVLSGELEVRKRGKGGAEARIAVLHPGDVAGEMALIDIQPRSAGVRSLGPASLVVLTHADLAHFYAADPQAYTIFVLNLAREISRRLRRVDALLADLILDVQEVFTGAMASTGVTTAAAAKEGTGA